MKRNKGWKTAHPSFYYRKASINPQLFILNTFDGGGGGGGGGLMKGGGCFWGGGGGGGLIRDGRLI